MRIHILQIGRENLSHIIIKSSFLSAALFLLKYNVAPQWNLYSAAILMSDNYVYFRRRILKSLLTLCYLEPLSFYLSYQLTFITWFHVHLSCTEIKVTMVNHYEWKKLYVNNTAALKVPVSITEKWNKTIWTVTTELLIWTTL